MFFDVCIWSVYFCVLESFAHIIYCVVRIGGPYILLTSERERPSSTIHGPELPPSLHYIYFYIRSENGGQVKRGKSLFYVTSYYKQTFKENSKY